MNILFICTGNTCRSPMAEYILKSMDKQKFFSVSSAGIFAVDDSLANELTIEVLSKNNIDATGFKSRKLTDQMIKSADLAICMTDLQAKHLNSFDNVRPISYYINEDVSDPFGKDIKAYEKTFSQLKKACIKILAESKKIG